MLISEAFNLYFQDKKLLGYSLHTLKSYNLQSKLLIRYLTDIQIEDIEYIDLKNYLLTLTHLKPASLGHRIRFIKSLL